jgi:hypothetical protein
VRAAESPDIIDAPSTINNPRWNEDVLAEVAAVVEAVAEVTILLGVVLARRDRATRVDQVPATPRIIGVDVVADRRPQADQTLPEMARQIR